MYFPPFDQNFPSLFPPTAQCLLARDTSSYSAFGQFVQCSIDAGNEICTLHFLNGCRSQNPLCMAMSQDSAQPLTCRIMLHRSHRTKHGNFSTLLNVSGTHFITHKKTTFFPSLFLRFSSIM